MNALERSHLLRFFRERHDRIVNHWYNAIVHTGFTSLTAMEMRRHLGALTDQAITVLLSDPLERCKAQAIGSALASTHYLSPETLSRSQEVLASQLVEKLPEDQAAVVRPRLTTLLAEIAAGFSGRACDTILLEQEEIRAALINEHKQTEDALREAEERFREAFENAPIGMALVSLDNRRYLRVNRSLCEMLGYSEKQLLAKTAPDITHPEDLEISSAYVDRLLKDRSHKYNLEKRYIHAEGHTVWATLSVSLIQDSQGNPSHFVAQYQDITERKALEEQLKHQALHDPLTDLPNRILFLDRLRQALAQNNRRGGNVQVLFLDLDNFKLINDSLGHMAGDQLLLKVANRLKACLRSQDTIARFGGDEFAILLKNTTGGVASAILVAERILKELYSPFLLGSHEVFATVSIGIISSTSEQNLPEDMLLNADMAMYRAKAKGKAQYEVFESSMNVRIPEQLELANDLRRAVEREEFVIHYQPEVEIATSKIVGMEALLRWEHPKKGLIPPGEFIPLAEETGLIVPIGQWVIEEVCHQAHAWQKGCPRDPPLIVSINLSARQLRYPRLIQEFAQALQGSEVDVNALELEITESIVMQDEKGAFGRLKELKSLGVRLAIDDFGTGYSSLAHLYYLPADTLKIDKAFVWGLGKDSKAESIISATTKLAQTLGLKIIAEGVETAEQIRWLRSLGCSLAQGNYFTQPLPSKEASAFLATDLHLRLK